MKRAYVGRNHYTERLDENRNEIDSRPISQTSRLKKYIFKRNYHRHWEDAQGNVFICSETEI